MDRDALTEWGKAELARRAQDWRGVQERATQRALDVGITPEQAAEAVRDAIAAKHTQEVAP